MALKGFLGDNSIKLGICLQLRVEFSQNCMGKDSLSR